jgi:type I restriction enzyme S subunit
MGLKPEIIELGAVTQWLSGGTPSRSIQDYWNGAIPWISATTLRKIDIFESDQCVTPEAVSSGSKMAPIDSTLLLVRGSALHNEIRAGIVCKPVCFNQDVKALIPSKRVYPRYITYSLLGRESELLKLVSSAGNTAGVLDTKLVQAFKIWLPDLNEQRAIATALSDVDALLEGLDRLIAKKRDLKQAAMQQLLTGQTRLPGFEGEWEFKSLREVLEVRHGRSQHDVVVLDGKYPIWATGGEIGRTDIPLHEKPSVLIGRKGTIDAPRYAERPFWTVDTLFYTEILGENSAKYLFYRFCMIPWKNYNEASGVPSLNAKTIESIELKLPSSDEQKAIAVALSDMDAEIEAVEQRRAKTAALKQAMMQELLTGRVRLV